MFKSESFAVVKFDNTNYEDWFSSIRKLLMLNGVWTSVQSVSKKETQKDNGNEAVQSESEDEAKSKKKDLEKAVGLIADTLTKPLAKNQFKKHLAGLSLRSHYCRGV